MIQDRYACKKIISYIEERALAEGFRVCAERLRQEGAEVVCLEGIEHQMEGVQGFDLEEDVDSTGKNGREIGEGILLVTDSKQLNRWAQEKGLPVLIVLHGQNKEEIFPGVRYYIEGFEETGYDYFDRIYCRYRGLPWTVTETERLRIRELTVQDVETLYRIYSHPDITRYMEDLFPEPEQERKYADDYRKYVYEFYDFGIWGLVEKETGELIGRAGIEYKEELGSDSAELGFVICREKQRRGYALEACRAIINYGWEQLELQRIYAFVLPENTASIQLLAQLGFQESEKNNQDKFKGYELVSCMERK